MVSVRKRGKVYQYQFDVAPIDGKRKRKTKSGFATKKEALEEGIYSNKKCKFTKLHTRI